MTGETYTHISRPVNRLAEKNIRLVELAIAARYYCSRDVFFGLVLFSNESSIQSLENSIANNATLQELLTNNNMNATQFVIMLQNGVWAFIVYLIICLLISFLALISMNHRIVSGLLFFACSNRDFTVILYFSTTLLLYHCAHDVRSKREV